MKTHSVKTAIKYGIILGFILTILTILGYLTNLDIFLNFWFGISTYFISIIFGLASLLKAKQLNKGFLSFKEAFKHYFISVALGITILTLITFILFNFIDVDAANELKEKSIERVIDIYKHSNKTEKDIQELIQKAKSENLYSIKNSINTLIRKYLLTLSIIGLLIASAFKKNNPSAE